MLKVDANGEDYEKIAKAIKNRKEENYLKTKENVDVIPRNSKIETDMVD